MNRTILKVLIAMVAVMAAGGIGALAWRWLGPAGPPADPRGQIAAIVMLAGFPIALAGVTVFARRYLGSQTVHLADDHRRHLEISLVVTFATAMAIQAWAGFALLGEAPFDRLTLVRLAAAWFGLSLMVRGNFIAKVGPPSGTLAPDPAPFLRSMRRLSWSLVAVGAALLLSAFALPIRLLFIAMLAAGAAMMIIVVQQRREQGRPARS